MSSDETMYVPDAGCQEAEAEIARMTAELAEAQNAYGVYEAKWIAAQAERDALAAALRVMMGGINSFHPQCRDGTGCYCRPLIAIGKQSLASLASMETGHE